MPAACWFNGVTKVGIVDPFDKASHSFWNLALLAFEVGYKACERGDNLQLALENFKKEMSGTKLVQNAERYKRG
jgi:hypothetical protein